MIALIDTIFHPVLIWLATIKASIKSMIVPVAQPFDVGLYLGPFRLLGPYWLTFVTTSIFLACVYFICFVVVSYRGNLIAFKDTIKWW